MIPYDDNQEQVEFPWATIAIIALCTVIYIWQYYLSHLGPIKIAAGFGMIPARVTGHVQLPPGIPHAPSILTPLTAAFLHGGFFHLVGNMIFLWLFGKRVEDTFGKLIFVLFVVAASYGADTIEIALHSKEQTVSVGASGFIAGIMGAYLAMYPFAKISVAFFTMARGVSTIDLPAWVLLGAWIAMQIFSAASHDEVITHIGYWAHIGGFAAGVILARALLAIGLVTAYGEEMART